MKYTVCIIAFAGLLASPALAAPSPATRASHFFGVMECRSGQRTFDMVLRGGDRSNLPGELAFVTGSGSTVAGQHAVRASVDNKGLLIVRPGMWIGRPSAQGVIGFRGLTRPDGLVMAGSADVPGCSKVSLVLASDDGHWPILSAEYSVMGHAQATRALTISPAVARRVPGPFGPAQAVSKAPPPANASSSAPRAASPVARTGFRSRLNPGIVAKRGASSWIDTLDYPATAQREGLTGRHTVELTVGADGRVAACKAVALTGATSLVENTCRQITRRARFGYKEGVTSGVIGGLFYVDVQYACDESGCALGARFLP